MDNLSLTFKCGYNKLLARKQLQLFEINKIIILNFWCPTTGFILEPFLSDIILFIMTPLVEIVVPSFP